MNRYFTGDQRISTVRIVVKAGLIVFVLLVTYFLFMKYMDLIQIIEFRALNFIILFGGILGGFITYRVKSGNYPEYLPGLWFGCSIAAACTIPFALFAGFYFLVIDPRLLEQLHDTVPLMGEYVNPLTVVLTIVLEGIVSGFVISYTLMQYYKSDATHI